MSAPVSLVVLNSPMPVRPHYADTFAGDGEACPMCCELAIEAWERMTTAGLRVEINEHPRPRSPWGIDRFREPTPPGGLRLYSFED